MAKQRRDLRASGVIRQRAKAFRQEQTGVEKALWQRLRGRQLSGLKFRRQHPIGRFVVDFFCAQVGLIVELDGEIHQGKETYDAERTEMLKAKGYHVMRFSNDEVERNIEEVLKRIYSVCCSKNVD